MTKGVPVNREDVLQYSQRWFASSLTCRRTFSGIVTVEWAIPLKLEFVVHANGEATRHRLYGA